MKLKVRTKAFVSALSEVGVLVLCYRASFLFVMAVRTPLWLPVCLHRS